MPLLIDPQHLLTELYAISNVPAVVWIDEDDRIVRPNSVAFSTDMFAEFTGAESGPHLDAVRAWVRDGTVGAATLWDPPGQRKPGLVEQLITTPTMLWAFRSRVPASMRVMELMEKHHPEEPHWYLMLIGSDPSVRGAGFGHALMRSRLDRCDAEGSPAYLENSNPKNEAYYLRFGFEIMGEINLPDGGPPMWPMWRNPR